MNMGETSSPSSMGETRIVEAADGLRNAYTSLSTASPTGREDSSAESYGARTARNLRSIVERRFKRMSEAHDRIRTKLLASHHRLWNERS